MAEEYGRKRQAGMAAETASWELVVPALHCGMVSEPGTKPDT